MLGNVVIVSNWLPWGWNDSSDSPATVKYHFYLITCLPSHPGELIAKCKKELIEWCMKEGLIASSYECPKCNDRHDVTWSAIKRFLRNRTSHAECMFDYYLAE
ncbi:uncharacterized protein TNCV_1138301 [Trichonephila clavipes]|nr:uncharacterized protein TNCV_1138301 [Trichonephila clavipes]